MIERDGPQIDIIFTIIASMVDIRDGDARLKKPVEIKKALAEIGYVVETDSFDPVIFIRATPKNAPCASFRFSPNGLIQSDPKEDEQGMEIVDERGMQLREIEIRSPEREVRLHLFGVANPKRYRCITLRTTHTMETQDSLL